MATARMLIGKDEAAAFTLLAQKSFLQLKLPKIQIDIQHIENGCFSGACENDPRAKEVHHYLCQAIALGDSKAHFYLATLFLNGWGVKVDIFKAMEHASQGARQKDPQAKDLSVRIGLMVEENYLRWVLGFRYLVSVFAVTNLSCTPERLAKISRRCLTINPKMKSPREELEYLYDKFNARLAGFNPFKRKERFIINFNYALATRDQGFLNQLSRDNPTLFKTLCQEEFLEHSLLIQRVQDKKIEAQIDEFKEPQRAAGAQGYPLMYRHLGIPEFKGIETAPSCTSTSIVRKDPHQEIATLSEKQPLLQQQCDDAESDEDYCNAQGKLRQRR
jgi:hypothetical protein